MGEGRNDEIIQILQLENITQSKAKRSTVIFFIALIVTLVIAYFLNDGLRITTILLVLLIIFATCIAVFYVLKRKYLNEEIEKIKEE